MKKIVLLLYLLFSTISFSQIDNFEEIHEGALSITHSGHISIMEDQSILWLKAYDEGNRKTSLCKTTKNSTDTIVTFFPESSIYNFMVSKTGRAFVDSGNKTYEIITNGLVLSNSNNEEFYKKESFIHLNEIPISDNNMILDIMAKFYKENYHEDNRMEGIENLTDIAEVYRYEKNNITLYYFDAFPTLGVNSSVDHFLIKINNGSSEIMYATQENSHPDTPDSIYYIIGDNFYKISNSIYGFANVYKLKGNFSNNLTLSTPSDVFSQQVFYEIQDNSVIPVKDCIINIYDFSGQKQPANNLLKNQPYFLNISYQGKNFQEKIILAE